MFPIIDEVVIRTNGGELKLDAQNDKVKFYGSAQVIDVDHISSTSLWMYGSASMVNMSNGRLVITNDEKASVGTIFLSATNQNYDNIILATQNGAELPEVIAREAVELPGSGEKKIIATVQDVDGEGTVQGQAEHIYLYGAQTSYEEEKGYENVSDMGTMILEAPVGTAGESFTIKVKDGEGTKDVEVRYDELPAEVKENKTGNIDEIKAAATMFAGGNGTKEKPYLITCREEFEAVTNMYGEGYKYYEVDPTSSKWSFIDKNGNPHMDGSDWKLITVTPGNSNRQRSATDFEGYLDCKGLIVDNLDCTLFKHLGVVDNSQNHEKGITTVKNLTVNRVNDKSDSSFGSYDYSAGIARDCGSWITLENVNVHGTIEGSSAASFIDFGVGNMTDKNDNDFHLEFNNCYSDATIIGTSGAAAGFVVNVYACNPSYENGIVYTIKDSIFNGTLLSTQNHATNTDIGENFGVGMGSYFAYQPTGSGSGHDQIVKFCYSNEFLAKYPDIVGNIYVCQPTKHSGNDWGAEIDNETIEGKQYETYTYKCHHSVTSIFMYVAKDATGNYKYGKFNVKTGVNPTQLGDVFTVSGCTSDHAVAYYYYAINPGNITYASASELLAISNGTYTTNNIKYAKFVLASSGTEGLSADGKTYTVVNNSATAIASVQVKLVEYDNNNNVVGITTWTITDAK